MTSTYWWLMIGFFVVSMLSAWEGEKKLPDWVSLAQCGSGAAMMAFTYFFVNPNGPWSPLFFYGIMILLGGLGKLHNSDFFWRLIESMKTKQ